MPFGTHAAYVEPNIVITFVRHLENCFYSADEWVCLNDGIDLNLQSIVHRNNI